MGGAFDDFLKTTPYAGTENTPVQVVAPLHDETITYQSGTDIPDDTTIPAGKTTTDIPGPIKTKKGRRGRTASHNLGAGDTIELNSISYYVLEIISDEGKTAEAVIYKVRNPQGKIYALKLYYEFSDSHLEPSPDTLQRIREIGGKEILNLFDFGTGPNKYQGRYCFEITDFAAGSDLLNVEDIKGKYTLDFLENTVITGIHNAIRLLHDEKIYHCDLKPHNVFFSDQEQTSIVIGDFGSAKSFEKTSEKELSHTTITKGTEFYLAPEQAFGIVSEKNDYYSFGMIILHLLYPDQVTKKNLRKIFERRTKGVRIIDFDRKYERLNQLIEGLTLQDYNSRWGANEVATWVSGATVSINYRSSDNRNYLKIGENIIYSGKDLAGYIEDGNPFYDELIEDREGYLTLLRWINHVQGEESKKLFDEMVTHYKNLYGIDYVREAILFYFVPARPFIVGATTFQLSNSKAVVDDTSTFFQNLDQLWKISDLSAIRLLFFQFEFSLQQIRIKAGELVKDLIDDILKRIAGIIKTDLQEDFSDHKATLFDALNNHHLIYLFHEFNPGRAFLDFDGNSYNSPKEILDFFEAHTGLRNNELIQLEKRGYLHKMKQEELLGFIESCDEFADFLFSFEEDFYVVADAISRVCGSEFSDDFIREFLLYYQKFDNEIFKHAILILLNNNYVLTVGDLDLNFFEKGNFSGKVKAFFKKLDEIWADIKFSEVKVDFFKFEFLLLRMAKGDPIAYKTMIKPALDNLYGDADKGFAHIEQLQASLFDTVDDSLLLDALYRFIPSRAFKASPMLSLDTLHDIGVFYVDNPELYTDRTQVSEREAFIRYHHHRAFSGLNYNNFILKVFNDQVKIETKTSRILFDEPAVNETTVIYNYSLSLSDYFTSIGYENDFHVDSNEPESVIIKKGHIVKDDLLFQRFSESVLQKHSISDTELAGQSGESFHNVVEQKKQLENIREYTFIPYYILFLLPIFGVLFMAANYMLNSTALKDISFSLSPALSMVSARLARTNPGIMVFNAYILNIITGFFLWLTLLILRDKTKIFEKFISFYGRLMRKIIVFFVIAPLLFVSIYFLINQIIGETVEQQGNLGSITSVQGIFFLLYILLLLRYLVKIVWALFKSYKKFRIMPLLVSVAFYAILGYISLLHQNLIH